MLVCCVKTGDKYSNDYVYKLRDGIERYFPAPFDFVCFGDRPVYGVETWATTTLPGWWAKLELFRLRMPLVFFDLDVIITRDLTPLVEWDGFGIIKDWTDWGQDQDMTGKLVTPMFNSSVMKLTGEEHHVWDEFKPVVMERFKRGGDQRWITRCLPEARTFPAEWFASYKVSGCVDNIPPDVLAVIFHGHPKPHEVTEGWVPRMWNSEPPICSDAAHPRVSPSSGVSQLFEARDETDLYTVS